MLFGAFIENGLSNWQIVQQMNGYAHIKLSGSWAPDPNIQGDVDGVYLRVIKEETNDILIWWSKAEDLGDFRWQITLQDVPAGGTYRFESCLQYTKLPYMENARRGDIIHHVGVGDIYVIAGQSNSAGFGKGSIYDPPEIGVHLLKNSGKWDLATHPMNDSTAIIHSENLEDTTPGHSPYLCFAKMLKRELGYPIGLIQASRGGSALSRWNPAEEGDLYRCMVNIIKSQGGMVKGILWYQGCSDALMGNGKSYFKRFENMVAGLRNEINIPELPFLTVQLNRHTAEKEICDDKEWGMIREAQRQAAKIPNVFIVSSTDRRLSDGIHNSSSANMVIGERLAKLALYGIYHKLTLYGAPNIIEAKKEDGKSIKLKFESVFDRLFWYDLPPCDLPITVEDSKGSVCIAAYHASGNEITLKLKREAHDGLVVHGAYEANPSYFSPVDTRIQMPMLSFYNFEVN